MDKLFSVAISDCEVQHFRSGGKGGQNQNKRDTGARVIHHPSGARGESREFRTQLENKRAAFKRMTEDQKFKLWLNREIWIRDGLKSPEEQAEEAMAADNLKVEYRVNGRWTDADV